MTKVGRNDPCPCGSGKKYKKCCGQKSPMQRRTFANLTPGNAKDSMSKISGMVSQNLTPEKEDETATTLSDRLSKGAPEKKEEPK